MTTLVIYDQLARELGDPRLPAVQSDPRHAALDETQPWTRPDDWDVELPVHGRRTA